MAAATPISEISENKTPILLTSSPNCMKYENGGYVFIPNLSSFYTYGIFKKLGLTLFTSPKEIVISGKPGIYTYIIIDNTDNTTGEYPYIFAAIKTLGALELTSKHGAILKIYNQEKGTHLDVLTDKVIFAGEIVIRGKPRERGNQIFYNFMSGTYMQDKMTDVIPDIYDEKSATRTGDALRKSIHKKYNKTFIHIMKKDLGFDGRLVFMDIPESKISGIVTDKELEQFTELGAKIWIFYNEKKCKKFTRLTNNIPLLQAYYNNYNKKYEDSGYHDSWKLHVDDAKKNLDKSIKLIKDGPSTEEAIQWGLHKGGYTKRNKHRCKKQTRKYIKNKNVQGKRFQRKKKTKTKRKRKQRGGTITSNINIGGLNFHKETGGKYLEKNPITGEYDAYDRDCYGIGWLKWCKKKKEVTKKPWWSFW